MVANAIPATTPVLDVRPLTVPRRELAKVLDVLCKVADKRSSIAALACIKFHAEHGQLALTATDLNLSVTYIAPTRWGAPVGGLVVNAKALADLVKRLPGESLTLAKSGNGLTVAGDGVDTTLIGAAPDYPKIPAMPERMTTCDGPVLGDMLTECLPFVCKDETRFHLNGVLVECTDSNMRAVATDGHRLTKITRRDVASLNGHGIVPAKSAAVLGKLLTLDPAQTALAFSGKLSDGNGPAMLHASINTPTGTWEASAKLIDAQYPPYDQVIPTDDTKSVTVNRKDLIAALKRAKSLASATHGTRLDVATGKISLVSDHPDTGTSTETLKASGLWIEESADPRFPEVKPLGPDGFKIGVNPRFMLEACEAIGCKDVTLAFNAELDPITIRGTDDSIDYQVSMSRLICVVMPMRI